MDTTASPVTEVQSPVKQSLQCALGAMVAAKALTMMYLDNSDID